MVRGMFKSRTLRRVFVKTPGGAVVTHYRKRKPSHTICGTCKSKLSGVPRERPYKVQGMARSERKPERPYGGNLCSSCTRDKIKAKTRQQ